MRRGRLGSVGVVVGLVAVGACGEPADVEAVRPAGFEATPAYLASAVDDLDSVPHRFEMTLQLGFEVDGQIRGLDPTRMTGEFDGEREHVRMEGGLADRMGTGAEQIVDVAGRVLYIRSPGAADALDELPDIAVTDVMRELAELGDRWGRADMSSLADVLPDDWEREVTQIKVQGLTPASFAGLVANADDVEELEPEEIQDEMMTGLAATVPAEDFAAAQRTSTTTTATADPTTTTTSTTGPEDAPEPGSLGDVLSNLSYHTEAWIDGDGNIRRLVLDMRDTIGELAERTGNPDLADGPRMGSVITLDLFDYGDDSIEIHLPDPDDTEDITAALRSTYER